MLRSWGLGGPRNLLVDGMGVDTDGAGADGGAGVVQGPSKVAMGR
jgi:hypothetical protein